MANSRETTKGELGQHAAAFERCVRGALEDYGEQYGRLRHKHSKRTEASIIHDLMIDRLTTEFGALEDAKGDVAVHRRGNLRQLVAKGGAYKIKLKKLDSRLLTRNIPTNAVLEFIWQEPQLAFEQVPAPTNLHLGYEIVDEAALLESRVWVTCPNGQRVGWAWELTEGAEKRNPSADLLTIGKQEPEKQRVTLKGAARQQNHKDKKAGGNGGSSDSAP